jgi:cystathionine beta-lyase/cystathionine gamma-synthase
MLAGVILGSDFDLIAQLRGTRAILGNILQPAECWLLEEQSAAGVTESLIRISVGVEDRRDLLFDYGRALDSI